MGMEAAAGLRLSVGRASVARRGSLAALLGEAASARFIRHLEGATKAVEEAGPDLEPDAVEAIAARARAELLLERHLGADRVGEVRLDEALSTLVTRRQLASSVLVEAVTSMPVVVAPGPVATALVAALCELVHVFEVAAVPGAGVRIVLAVGIADGGLLIALAARGVDLSPVPSRGAAHAIRRAGRIVRLVDGDLTRGVRDETMLFGMVVGTVAPVGSVDL